MIDSIRKPVVIRIFGVALEMITVEFFHGYQFYRNNGGIFMIGS